ncbi:MAG: tripartite tricarboxylate transporter substrate binding protein [bacterium]
MTPKDVIRTRRRTAALLLPVAAAAALLLPAGCSRKEKKFPSKPITVICPPAPGGTSDLVTRTISYYAEKELGVPVIVVNKTGGAGAVGMSAGAKAKPDGYTVTYVVVEIAILPHRGLAPVSYDDFDLLFRINHTPAALTVNSGAPWKSFRDFAAYAAANPGRIRVGNSGAFSIWHLAAARLEQSLGTDFLHIPHKGAAPAVKSLLGGHIDAVTVAPAEVQTNVEAGKLRMLAVLDEERDPNFPDVPAAAETGSAVSVGAWGGMAAPKGTPETVKKTLIEGFRKAYDNPEFQKKMKNQSVRLGWLDGEDFLAFVREQSEGFRKTIEKLEIR